MIGRGWSPFLARLSDPERFPLGPISKIPDIIIKAGDHPVFLLIVPFLAQNRYVRRIGVVNDIAFRKPLAVTIYCPRAKKIRQIIEECSPVIRLDMLQAEAASLSAPDGVIDRGHMAGGPGLNQGNADADGPAISPRLAITSCTTSSPPATVSSIAGCAARLARKPSDKGRSKVAGLIFAALPMNRAKLTQA
ncbi:MAG: hypothetical protein QM682_11880 [Paracoccus sp. (in: a-proteobacteria)]|uniref:hypothetical protein n=1 Tax=Paracoccus sp. TaxID=267 RepID=UPI0039E5B9DE